jgi:hypothetical protein
MFSIFMEKAFMLCRVGGYLGQIVPNAWLTNTYSSKTRQFVLQGAKNLCITVPTTDAFPKLSVDTVVYTLQRTDRQDTVFSVSKMNKDGSLSKPIEYETTKFFLYHLNVIPAYW